MGVLSYDLKQYMHFCSIVIRDCKTNICKTDNGIRDTTNICIGYFSIPDADVYIFISYLFFL